MSYELSMRRTIDIVGRNTDTVPVLTDLSSSRRSVIIQAMIINHGVLGKGITDEWHLSWYK